MFLTSLTYVLTYTMWKSDWVFSISLQACFANIILYPQKVPITQLTLSPISFFDRREKYINTTKKIWSRN